MNSMGFIDGHLHSIFLSFYDLKLMVDSGYDGFVTLAYTPIPPSSVSSLRDHYEHLLFEKNRCGVLGLRVIVGVGIHPRCIPKGRLEDYISLTREYLEQVEVLGEVGLETGSDLELGVLEKQLNIAKELDLPVIVHTPRSNKIAIVKKIIEVLDRIGISSELVLIDHLTPSPLLLDMVLSHGLWAGFSIQEGKTRAMDVVWVVEKYPELADRIVLNSDSGLYPSNPIALKNAYEVLSSHLGRVDAYKLVSLNALRFLRL